MASHKSSHTIVFIFFLVLLLLLIIFLILYYSTTLHQPFLTLQYNDDTSINGWIDEEPITQKIFGNTREIGVRQYQLYYSTDAKFTNSKKLAITSPFFTIKNLSSNSLYYCEARVQDSEYRLSKYSFPSSIIPQTLTPLTITTLTTVPAPNKGYYQVKVTFSEPPTDFSLVSVYWNFTDNIDLSSATINADSKSCNSNECAILVPKVTSIQLGFTSGQTIYVQVAWLTNGSTQESRNLSPFSQMKSITIS